MDWLLTAIDPDRAHDISQARFWHGRIMVLAWAFLAPLTIMTARFFKIWPGQDWPQRLDHPYWWRIHWIGNVAVIGLSLTGFLLIRFTEPIGTATIHQLTGYALLLAALFQGLGGLSRGSKGGPTALAKDGSLHGDHYDMTLWRRVFEWSHKCTGYVAIGLTLVVIPSGLWAANAPVWMFLSIGVWWMVLAVVFVRLQRAGRCIDTYQAIWGPAPDLPGNRHPPIGWGIRRPLFEEIDQPQDEPR